MEFETTRLEGVMLVRPRVFEDDRGSFTETWNMEAFAEVVGESVQFKQSNESVSRAGVLRGLHFKFLHAAKASLCAFPEDVSWTWRSI